MGKSILVFVNLELYKVLYYKTKKQTTGNYNLFLKHGILDPNTGEKIQNATFELV
jgi:hypothetical protein